MNIKFILVAALSVPCLFAQGAPVQHIAIIDMQSALVSTKDGVKAVADLRAKFNPKNEALQRRQQELQAKQDQYRRTQNTMSDEAKANLERDIDTLNRAYQRDQQDDKDEMDQSEQQMVASLGDKIMKSLTKYAADNHLTMVFDVSGQPNNILFASNSIDITREIIALYDKDSGNASPAAAPAAAASKPAPRPSGAVQPKPAAPLTPGR